MKSTILVLNLLLVFLLSTFAWAAAGEGRQADSKELARLQNVFAAKLYSRLSQHPGNLFLSPQSIASALSMTFLGARGDTAAEMAEVLDLKGLEPTGSNATGSSLRSLVLDTYASQYHLLNEPQKEGLELHIANALWVKANYLLKPDFIKGIKQGFGSGLEAVDFSNAPVASKKINDWVSDQTKGKIMDLISPAMLTPDTRLVLTNAIYFKAAWEEQFRKEATAKEKFHVSPGKDVDARMMKQVRFFKLARLEGFKLLEIPYKGRQASLLVLLPDKVDGLADVEKSLTAQNLDSWLKKSESARVSLSLPSFKNTSRFDLNEALSAMGMKKAFVAGRADFTGIADKPDEPLFIGMVVHKAFIDLNEEGTEAAAATALTMRAGAAMRQAEPVPFVADHPFLYMIRDNRTGGILFIGRLADPSA